MTTAELVAADLAREIMAREKDRQYVRNMVEDAKAQVIEFRLRFERHDALFTKHIEDDKIMAIVLASIDKRLAKVERLIWIAMGWSAAIAGVVGVVGHNLSKILGGA